MVKGCLFHFKQSVDRVKRSVPLHQQKQFVKDVDGLLSEDLDVETYNDRVVRVASDYPTITPWITWWSNKNIAPLIFPACRTMSRDVHKATPSRLTLIVCVFYYVRISLGTTNAQESAHSVLYGIFGKHHSLQEGIHNLRSYVQWLEDEYGKVLIGYSTKYGQARKAGAVPNTKKKQKRTPRRYNNDGRAPDCNNLLKKWQAKRRTHREIFTHIMESYFETIL